MCMGNLHDFPPFLQRETTFVTSYLLPRGWSPFKRGSTLKGKNLLLLEQILSFKS